MRAGSRLLALLGLLSGCALQAQQLVPAGPDVLALTYHDVRVGVMRDYDRDQFAVSAQHLAEHFAWLRANGYTVVRLDDVLAARRGERTLPPRAVLITFDDGLRSVYTQVFPLLRLFGYPAVVSLVTSWMETPVPVAYDERTLTAESFLTWAQVREMQDSGLVEIASHSHALHAGVPGNPQGNLEPAAVTRIVTDAGYEDEAHWRQRLRDDLARSSAAIVAQTRRAPRVISWPYGAWNEPAHEVATGLGMPVSFGLNGTRFHGGADTVIERELVMANPGIADFAGIFTPRPSPLLRALRVDLAEVYDPDQGRQEARLGQLLERVRASGVSHVLLGAAADTDGDGRADASYFPTRELPLRTDLFNRAAWQLATRCHVRVFASLPVAGYAFVDSAAARESVAGRIHAIYADLAVHAQFDGLLFEQAGAAAVTPGLDRELAATVRRYRPEIVTAGGLAVDLRSDSGNGLAAGLRTTLGQHEFAIVALQPAALSASAAARICGQLMPTVNAQPRGAQRTVIDMPQMTGDRTDADLPNAIATLSACGIRNFAWQTDMLPGRDAEFVRLRPLMSAAEMPWKE